MEKKYECRKCSFSFPQEGANISGDESYKYGFHVHCPQCGAVVAQFIKTK